MKMFEQNNKIVVDVMGRRWVKCLICGKVDFADNFLSYGGLGQVNKGKCRECVRKLDRYKGGE